MTEIAAPRSERRQAWFEMTGQDLPHLDETLPADVVLSADEAALIQQMRTWKDGIPDSVLPLRKESGVYVSLVAARAELFRMALLHGHNDMIERRERMLKLIGPGLLIELCRAWEKLQARQREDEHREVMEGVNP